MKWLILFIGVLLASVLLALLALNEPGYVLIAYQDWRVETTVSLLAIALLASGVVSYLLVRLFFGLLHTPRRLGSWRHRYRGEKAESALNRGMLALFEGHWQQAEKQLLKKPYSSHAPLLNYLGAARAAHQQGAFERRDDYLHRAHQADPSAEVAVGLTQARLQLDQGQLEQALATLEKLRDSAPKHPLVLALLADVYEKLRDWQRLEDLLPELKRLKVIDDERYQSLMGNCYNHLLQHYARHEDLATLQQLWRRIPKLQRNTPALAARYAEALLEQKHDDLAVAVLKEHLEQQWDGRLIELYGRVQASNGQAQLAQAERWLQAHPKDPLLLLALGRICRRNTLWGKAKDYLQQAVGSERVEVYQELTSLLEEMNERDNALDYYRKGLLSVDKS